jgi:hypothetical protein
VPSLGEKTEAIEYIERSKTRNLNDLMLFKLQADIIESGKKFPDLKLKWVETD